MICVEIEIVCKLPFNFLVTEDKVFCCTLVRWIVNVIFSALFMCCSLTFFSIFFNYKGYKNRRFCSKTPPVHVKYLPIKFGLNIRVSFLIWCKHFHWADKCVNREYLHILIKRGAKQRNTRQKINRICLSCLDLFQVRNLVSVGGLHRGKLYRFCVPLVGKISK